jgi:hypothetical protein
VETRLKRSSPGLALCLAGSLSVAAIAAGVGSSAGEARATAAGASRQALRTCVDRWNEDNMVGWKSRSVRIAFRALTAQERRHVSFGDDARRRCTVSLAQPGSGTWICRIESAGAYDCPLHTSDGMPPLKHSNGRTNRHGVLVLDSPLSGTHATPPLRWQRVYPHVDSFILPWTRAGRLRPGLHFETTRRGACVDFLEVVAPAPAGRCLPRDGAGFYEPCFPQRRHFRRGELAACSGAKPTTFVRVLVTRGRRI